MSTTTSPNKKENIPSTYDEWVMLMQYCMKHDILRALPELFEEKVKIEDDEVEQNTIVDDKMKRLSIGDKEDEMKVEIKREEPKEPIIYPKDNNDVDSPTNKLRLLAARAAEIAEEEELWALCD